MPRSILIVTTMLILSTKAQIPETPIPPLHRSNEILMNVVKHLRQSLPKFYVQSLNKTYTEKCSQISEEDLVYDDDQIDRGDYDLRAHMAWAREAPTYHNTRFFSESRDPFKIVLMLSWMGKGVIVLAQASLVLAVSLGLLAILFYCFPELFQQGYSWMSSDRIERNHLKGKAFFAYPYYKDMKNWMSRKRISPFNLYGLRFVSSGVVCFSLLVTILQIMRVETTNDCGLIRASLDIVVGKEGTMFRELGLLSNKSLLHNFKIDLDNYQRRYFEGNYQKLIDMKFDTVGENVEISMGTYYKKVSDLQLRSCTADKKIKPFFIQDMDYGINDDIHREVKRVVKLGADINDAADYLKSIHVEKDAKVERFMFSVKQISQAVDLIFNDIFYVTYNAQKYLTSYDNLMSIICLVALAWFIYIMTQMIPPSVVGGCRLPKTGQLSIQFTGAAIMFLLGGYLFIETQTMIQGCVTAKHILDDPESMKLFLGAQQEEWINVCLTRSGSGDLEDLVPRESKSEFFHGFNVIRGFSTNLTNITDKFIDYKSKAVAEYEKKINDYQNFHANLYEHYYKDSYAYALDNINGKINCTGITFAVSTHKCRSEFSNHDIVTKWPEGIDPNNYVEENFEKFPKGNICVVLPQLEPPMNLVAFEKIIGRYSCIKKKKNNQIKNNFHQLSKCLSSHDDFMTVVSDHFKVVTLKSQTLNKKLVGVTHIYSYLREDFKMSIMSYERAGHDVEKILNCKSMRKAAEMMLGNFCYSSKGVAGGISYHHGVDGANKKFGFGAWFWFFIAGFGLLVISASNFLEGLLDKTVLRKYRELSGRRETGGKGFGTELGPI